MCLVGRALWSQVLDEARRVVDKLDEREADGRHTSAVTHGRRLADLYDVAHKLACVAHSWAQDPEAVDTVKHLKALRAQARTALRVDREVAAEGAG